jgi:hypothetical protein
MQPTPSPLLLEYRHAPAPATGRADWLFLLLGLPALVALFVPFTFGVSPVQVVRESPGTFPWTRWEPEMAIVLVTLPLFLPVAASALRLRMIVSGREMRGERWASYAAAAIGAAAVLALLAAAVAQWWDMAVPERWMFGAGAAVLAGGAVAVLALRRRGARRDVRALATMLVPYAADCTICLIAFREEAQLGWYLTAVSAAAALAEVVVLTVRAPQA